MIKHHRKKLRLEGYDYNQPGEYFITICTKKLICYFGSIRNEHMQLSQVGKIAKRCWEEIPKHFKYVELDAFVVMPNHVHGIVRIVGSVVTADLRSLQRNNNVIFDRSKMLLPKIIQGFESTVTRIIHRKNGNIPFSWQKSYYDHIIETDEEFDDIREYIELNPLNWQSDLENLKYNKNLPRIKRSELTKRHYRSLFRRKLLSAY